MSEEKLYVSKLHIDDTDNSTYWIKDTDTLAYAKALKQDMGSFQTQLSLIISQLQALEQKVNNPEGEKPEDTDTLTKTEVEQIAADAAFKALDSNQDLKTLISNITAILDQAETAYDDFQKAEEKIDTTIDYAQQAAQSAASSRENSLNALAAISPIITDYAYSTTDIARNTTMLIEQYDNLNTVKTKAQATATSLIDGQEISTSLIKKTSESLAKSSTTMSAQYGNDPSQSPLTDTLSRISSNVSQTASKWGVEVSSFSYQQASSDEETQEKVNKALQEYEEALKAQEAAYKALNDSTIAYNEAKQWQGYAQTLLNESQSLYDTIQNDYGDVTNEIKTAEKEINEVSTKITNCISKIASLTGSKDKYRQELQEAVQVLVGLYGNGQVTDSAQAMNVVNAKVAAIEDTSDEVSVNLKTFLELLDQYGEDLSSYLTLASRGGFLQQSLDALEGMKDEVNQDLEKANALLATTSAAYNDALKLLTTTADGLDKAANGLVVSQISATEVRQGEIVSYVNAVKESAVQYRKSLSAKYTDFVNAVQKFHDYSDFAKTTDSNGNITYQDGDVRFWFYTVDPAACTAQDFIARFGGVDSDGNKKTGVSRKAYADYYYNTNTSNGYYWDGARWDQIISEEDNDAAFGLLAAFKIAQNYSDIEDDNYRNLYFYDSGYYNEDTSQLYSPKEYNNLTQEEQKKITVINKGFPADYQLGDIWYSEVYSNDVTITKIVPYYLTYPYAAGVSTLTSHEYSSKTSVGNWVSETSQIQYIGQLSESDELTQRVPYLWYYCEVTYSNGNVVKTQPTVVAYHDNTNTTLQIQPYILVTSSASSKVNTNYTTIDSSQIKFDCDWQPIDTTYNDPTDTGESGWKFLNFGVDNPYLFTFVKIDEKYTDPAKPSEDKSSSAIYIDGYTYHAGIMSAELEYQNYNPAAWVDCWVSQSRQISGSLNNIWEYVNSTIAQTNNEILSTVKHLAQLENDTFDYKGSGIDQTEEGVNIYAMQRQGKANAFYSETAAETQIKECKNQIPQGGSPFNPWEEIYEYEERTRVRIIQNNNMILEADYPREAAYYNENDKILTYDPKDNSNWRFTFGTAPTQKTSYAENDYELVFSNFLQNGKKKNGRLINTNITVKFTNNTEVYMPLIRLLDQDGKTEIMPPIPVAAYGKILNNYSAESVTDAAGNVVDSNKAYNWESEALVGLTLHIPTEVDATTGWYTCEDDVYPTSDGYSLYYIGKGDGTTKYGQLYKCTVSAAGEIPEDGYGDPIGDIYWEICDSSGLKKSSQLKVEVDKIESIVKDTSIGLTKLRQNPSGFSFLISSAANRSDANVLALPDSYNDENLNTYDGHDVFPLGIVNLSWEKALENDRNSSNATEENLPEGEYYPPLVVGSGVQYYSFINTSGGTAYITTYKNKTVSLKANLNYRIGCYIKKEEGKDCTVQFHIGKPPQGAAADDTVNNGVQDTNLKSAVKESGTYTIDAISEDNSTDEDWSYYYAVFQYDAEKYGLTSIAGSDVYTGARITFEFKSEGAYCVAGLHVSCLDSAEAVNNYMSLTAKDGLIIGDLAKTTRLGGKQELGANIKLSVADSVTIGTTTVSDPSLKLRYGTDSIVNVNALSATTFRGYGLLKTGEVTTGSGVIRDIVKLAPHKHRWVKITSQLAKPIDNSEDSEESTHLRSGGAPGIMAHNYTSTIGMYALDADSVAKKFGLKTKTDGTTIVNKAYSYTDDDGNVVNVPRHDLGMITGTTFMITPTISDNSRLSNNGSISFQSKAGDVLDIPSEYTDNSSWMDGSVVYSGQHIYDSKARIHGLWGYKAFMLYADHNPVKGDHVKFSSTIHATNTEGAAYFPGAVREISFYHNTGTEKNQFYSGLTANKTFNIMGYKINPTSDYDKDTNNTWDLTVYAQRMAGKTAAEKDDDDRWPLCRFEVLMFRRDWADTVPQFDSGFEETVTNPGTGLDDDDNAGDDSGYGNSESYMNSTEVYNSNDDDDGAGYTSGEDGDEDD